MEQVSPHKFLRELKELMQAEKEKLSAQKQLSVESGEFETAVLYRDIEKKLNNFINDLNFGQ